MQIVAVLGRLVLQLLPIFVFFGAGIVIRQRLLHMWHGAAPRLRDFQRGLNLVLMDVLLPAIAFLSMARLPLDVGWRLAWVPTIGLGVALLALALIQTGLALPALRPRNPDEQRALIMMAPWSNTVIVGLPAVATFVGADVLYVPFLESSFVWTLILGPLIIRGVANRALVWASIRPLLFAPWFWAIPLGLLWAILRLPLGGVGLIILERAREAFLALGLLVVGLGFDPARLRPRHSQHLPHPAIMLSGVIKLLICPLLALLLALPLGLPRDVPAALALTVATPPSLTAYIISEREGVEPEFMSFLFALYGVIFFATVLIVSALLVPLFAA